MGLFTVKLRKESVSATSARNVTDIATVVMAPSFRSASRSVTDRTTHACLHFNAINL